MKTTLNTMLIGIVAGFGFGFAFCWYIQSGHIEAARTRTEQAESREQNARFDLEQCKVASIIQNDAIDELANRLKDSQEALEKSKQERKDGDGKADSVMLEQTPAGTDACTAAQQAFSNELKRERGQ